MKGSSSSIDFMYKSLSFLFFFDFMAKDVFATPSKHFCHPEQRDALIKFKNEFKIFKPRNKWEYPKTESWKNNSDCCSWDGITCDVNSGNVIKLYLSFSCLSGQLNSKSNIFRLQSLRSLYLSENSLYGLIPSSLANLSKLTTLYLSNNNFNGQIPSSLANLSKLAFLYLFNNNFNGQIPSDFGKLNELVILDLASNKLNGNFPLSVLNLTKLSGLALSNNQFTGTLPPNMSSLSNLKFFDASYNAFTGSLPSSLFDIPSLSYIILGGNQLNGPLDFGNLSLTSVNLVTLKTLDLGKNKFRGPIPRSIVKLVNLETLDLSYLNTQSSVDFSIFSHFKSLRSLSLSHLNTTFDLNEKLSCFKSLQDLDISGNPVSLDIKSYTMLIFPLLTTVNFSQCGLTNFPEFLRSQYKIERLDISNNKIKGKVPGWLWSLPNLTYVDLSSNKFIGFERSMNPRLSSTKESQIYYLSGANNDFSGAIPSFICAYRLLEVIVFSNNKFNGSVPCCLGNFSTSLEVLNLRKNRLSGGIPKIISKGLVSLDIGHNQLVGKLPRSLVQISSLKVLNVESNKFNDTFPFWLSSLQRLQVLVLRSNEFHGPIQKVGFSKLRIIDISGNHFSGALPSDCFMNWTAMVSLGIVEDNSKREYMATDYYTDSVVLINEDKSEREYMGTLYYTDSMVLMNKGLEMELVHILKFFTAVDFSGNEFEGEIPSSIGLLKELIVLNFSNNAFTGSIPSTLANLTELESLDVSQNKLSGDIPQELGKLSYLSYMDFSHNQLVGPVPEGTQFQTQNCSSFKPNRGLFGPTIERVCGDMHKKTSQQSEMREEGEDEEEMISWRAAVIGFIPGIVFGFTMGYILLSHKPKLFIKNFGRNRR